MSQGRKPKSEFLRLIDGNRGRKAGGKVRKKKKATLRIFPCPTHLSDDAKRAWAMFEPFLRKQGLQSQDLAAFERLSELYSDVLALQAEVRKQRFYQTTNAKGEVMIRPHPAAGQLAETDRRFESYLSQFHLTPAARAKLLTGQKGRDDEDGDPIEAFFT